MIRRWARFFLYDTLERLGTNALALLERGIPPLDLVQFF